MTSTVQIITADTEVVTYTLSHDAVVAIERAARIAADEVLQANIDALAGAGVADGDKGDITVSASGATWTIDNGVVTLAKMANMATASVIYRKTAGTGAPEVQTLATLKTDLGLSGTNSGDQDLSSYLTSAAAAAEYPSMSTARTSNTFWAGPADASTASADFRRIHVDDLSPDNYGTATATKVLHGNMTWSKVDLANDVTGTLPVANGGTGATDASTARTNLGAQATITFGTGAQTALGVNVGSAGAVVVNGGALGTPSSGALTNCTSIPAGQLTGTVSLDRLVNTQTVGNADATITAGVRDVLLTAALTAARVYTLPAASGYPAGARLTFVDMAQTLTATNTATLQRAGSDTVNGGTSLVLNTAGASPLLISDGSSKWNLDIRGVSRGGTGRTSHTAYAVLCGGTTSTGAQQNVASVGTAGQVLKSGGAGALPAFADDIGSIDVVFDGGGSAVAANSKFYIQVPYSGTIVSVTSLADVSGSAVVDVWKDTYANYPPTVADTITASAKPTISATTKATDSTLTGWTTAITAGDVLGFNVDSCSTITRLVIQLKIRKS